MIPLISLPPGAGELSAKEDHGSVESLADALVDDLVREGGCAGSQSGCQMNTNLG